MRLSINIPDELYEIVKAMAITQNRTITKQIAHLVHTNNETVGWRAFTANPHFQALQDSKPVSLGK